MSKAGGDTGCEGRSVVWDGRWMGATQRLNGRNAKKAGPVTGPAFSDDMCGGVLLSREASLAVPSALRGLTSGFGMGPGVSPSLWPPQLYGIASLAPGRIPGTA
jgi:hypothetical protein